MSGQASYTIAGLGSLWRSNWAWDVWATTYD